MSVRAISISKSLRDAHPSPKYRIWWDSDNGILGLEPHDTLGYAIGDEKISCKTLKNIPTGVFPASWDKKQKMIIVNLKNT